MYIGFSFRGYSVVNLHGRCLGYWAASGVTLFLRNFISPE